MKIFRLLLVALIPLLSGCFNFEDDTTLVGLYKERNNKADEVVLQIMDIEGTMVATGRYAQIEPFAESEHSNLIALRPIEIDEKTAIETNWNFIMDKEMTLISDDADWLITRAPRYKGRRGDKKTYALLTAYGLLHLEKL